MGSKDICKKSTDGVLEVTVASWRESNGQYYLLEATNFSSLEKTADGLIPGRFLIRRLGDWVSGNLVGFQLEHNHVAWQKSLDLAHFDVHELSDAL
ncbi:uncharacterized protein BO87DRAFT_125318 [Aspergillus neoniger CBS 115656]|uniref:Uncharacterized protein n=1 Tax=Aspergillus neoniger (strain CBS 115656) TaxID=1448310 RepID=A0A318YFE0_ASPNB|nr:hypothetical protein BO87DRAFT_125318 [Aspergillus neoniger CBS 115656]PYH31400.1 hypothetical protein BO87DRAFT_125318 [Aspergillus neoniger CBS 115656]